MEVSFSHKLDFQDYKKWVVDFYYIRNKKRLYGYITMMLAGVVLIILKAVNAFHLNEHYPKETLYLLGGSFIITPILFYIGVIRNSKKYFFSHPNIYNEVKYVFDEEKISYESFDGNTGTCKWQNVNSIEDDADFIKIVIREGQAYLLVKNKIDPEKLRMLQQLLSKVKGRSGASDHFVVN